MGMEFEFTTPSTPQQYSHIEGKFDTLFNLVHVMLNDRKFTAFLRNDLWDEATNTVTLRKNNIIPNIAISTFQQFFLKGKRIILSTVQKLCEMCITTYRDNTHWTKLANQGAPGIWIVFAGGHPTDTYRAFNPKTNKIILSKDVTFLQKSYADFSKVEKPVLTTMIYEGLDDEEELKIVPVIYQNNCNNCNVIGNS